MVLFQRKSAACRNRNHHSGVLPHTIEFDYHPECCKEYGSKARHHMRFHAVFLLGPGHRNKGTSRGNIRSHSSFCERNGGVCGEHGHVCLTVVGCQCWLTYRGGHGNICNVHCLIFTIVLLKQGATRCLVSYYSRCLGNDLRVFSFATRG